MFAKPSGALKDSFHHPVFSITTFLSLLNDQNIFRFLKKELLIFFHHWSDNFWRWTNLIGFFEFNITAGIIDNNLIVVCSAFAKWHIARNVCSILVVWTLSNLLLQRPSFFLVIALKKFIMVFFMFEIFTSNQTCF